MFIYVDAICVPLLSTQTWVDYGFDCWFICLGFLKRFENTISGWLKEEFSIWCLPEIRNILLIWHFTFHLIYVWWHMNSHHFQHNPRSFGWISLLMRHKTRWFICHSSSVMNELSYKSVWVLFACEVNDSIRELHFRRITDWCWWWLEERRRSDVWKSYK